jgi:RNA-directed DNA polymerase
MKEPHGEGLARHTGPESCAAAREGRGEALTGADARSVLSRENRPIQSAGRLHLTVGNSDALAMREGVEPGAVGDPIECRSLPSGNREIPSSPAERGPLA